jgi:hypothetical protein
MRFIELPQIVQPKDHLGFYNEVAPEMYAPMNRSGHVNMDYLYALPGALGEFYLQVGGLSESAVKDVVAFDPSVELLIEEAEEVLSDPRLTTTERHVLVRARLGQGIFKEEVRRIEPACRLTGLIEPRHLIASHMKPWAQSNNVERLESFKGTVNKSNLDSGWLASPDAAYSRPRW